MDNDVRNLIQFLAEDCGWPLDEDQIGRSAWQVNNSELGLNDDVSVDTVEIYELRPLTTNQPWGVFFVVLKGTHNLSMQLLRRLLRGLVRKKRASADTSNLQQWNLEDLMFVCSLQEPQNVTRYFAHFRKKKKGLPKLMIGARWQDSQPENEINVAKRKLKSSLKWPDDVSDADSWRSHWAKAFKMQYKEVITSSSVLAKSLAYHAINMKQSISDIYNIESEDGPFHHLLDSFQTALISDLDIEKFSDMVAQTIAYGLFSARTNVEQLTGIENLSQAIPNSNPFLKQLFIQFTELSGDGATDIDFDDLSLNELIDDLNGVNMVSIMNDFGTQFKAGKEDPLIHLYEEFLEAFDKNQKKDRGVWYTPKPVVDFIVKRVHEKLIKDQNIPLGLADYSYTKIGDEKWHKVVILDPAVGTGTFLCGVIRIIADTMKSHWKEQGYKKEEILRLWNEYVDRSLRPRLVGFEIMMAPYTVAHININFQLKLTGYTGNSDDRLNVVLTNSLDPANSIEDWVPDYLSEEAELSRAIKQQFPVSVIIGNPPYSGESSNDIDWINDLIRTDIPDGGSSYFEIEGGSLNERNPKWLNDDYVKFIRFSQYMLSKRDWCILGFVNNHGWLDNPTFRGMRESILESFNRIDVIDLHGNVKKKEVSPTGSNENVFPIQQGVCINILQRSSIKEQRITHADVWGTKIEKFEALQNDEFEPETIEPSSPGYLFHPIDLDLLTEYRNGIPINDLFPLSSLGIVTARDKLTIGWNDKEIWNRISHFVSLKEESARSEYNLKKDARDWKVKLAQEDIRSTGPSKNLIQSIHYRAWDFRTTYYTGKTRGFHCMPRSMVMSNMLNLHNIGLISRRQMTGDTPNYFFVTDRLISDGVIRSDNKGGESLYPLFISINKETSKFIKKTDSLKTWASKDEIVPNLDHRFIKLMSKQLNLKFNSGMKNEIGSISAYDILYYSYAIFHSNIYRTRYSEYLMKSYPRVQFTTDTKLFSELTKVGEKLVRVHLLSFSNNEKLEIDGSDFEIHKGYPKYEDQQIYLNKTTVIKNISKQHWEYKIGVHQVLEKWLKDRKSRILSKHDILHYEKMVFAVKLSMHYVKEIDAIIGGEKGLPLVGFDQFSAYRNNRFADQKSIFADY